MKQKATRGGGVSNDFQHYHDDQGCGGDASPEQGVEGCSGHWGGRGKECLGAGGGESEV